MSSPWPWIGSLSETATSWEVAAALLGVAAIGYAGYGAVDNVFDLRYVRRYGVVGGPRWITATCLLIANVCFLLGWLGYTHVAFVAASLPGRADVRSDALSQVAAMRLGYALFGLLGQVALRWMRTKLRHLTPEQWAPLFGEAAQFQALYHEARAALRSREADLHRAQADFAEYRAENHGARNETTRWKLRTGLLERLLRQHGVEPPPTLTTREDE